ncbi:thiopeptide-type bacteriocin biosynthesis protein [Streptomyces sp. NPDC048483]|uniref:thiopeptide-type bacteriocin biosynthesis protein n=1 Tax=Streptomyces sp. NPDC048483 TaxID=3154927 RepID=UPI003431AFBE
MAETRWVSAHIFHQGDTDALILDALHPLTERLRASSGPADASFFLRYWDGGPHIRLRVAVPDPERREEVRGEITGACEAWFRRHPSEPFLDERHYAEQATILAARERMTAYEPRMYPLDSVQFLAYRPEYRRYGSGRNMAAVERHFAESSQIALTVLRAGASPKERQTAAYCMLLLAWFTCESDPARLEKEQLSDGADRYGPDHADRYERQRAALTGLLRSMRSLVLRRDEVPEQGTLGRWAHSVRRLNDSVTAPWRVLDACAHLLCNRLGVQLEQETYVRYLAVRAISEAARAPEGV